jgi:hypothetical protein
MFGRGNWAVFGVTPESVKNFRKALDGIGDETETDILQALALQKTKKESVPTQGINPFEHPRLDEPNDGIDHPLTSVDFALDRNYQTGDGSPKPAPTQFGMWVVFNDYEDVTDPASKKEAIAYKTAGRPFKFLNKDEKQQVESAVKAGAVVSRKQVPVLIDFPDGRAYAATTNKDEILAIQDVLDTLGADCFALAWQFGSFDWPSKFLSHIAENTKFSEEMRERAEELAKSKDGEVPKLNDKVMESIVSTFFALAPLDTGLWGGLTSPTRIRIFDMEPIGVSQPSAAFILLDEKDLNSSVAAASVIFQNIDSRINKKTDEEVQVRINVLAMDVNDNLNNLDAGAGLLKGFDLPQFKKEIKTAVKAGTVTIADYWRMWLVAMREGVYTFTDNVAETLQLDIKKVGLRVFGEKEAKTEKATV